MKADLVSGVLPVREDGRILLLQRPQGTWEPPAGRLVAGESFEEGAVRELYEETGLLVTPERILATWVGRSPRPTRSSREAPAPAGPLLASVTYIGRTSGAGVQISAEHLGYRWATIDEWLSLPSWWSAANIRRAAGAVRAIRNTGASVDAGTNTYVGAVREAPPYGPFVNGSDNEPPRSKPPPGPRGNEAAVEAHLGAGTVLVDLEREEPRALLLRRRKPPVGLWENPGGMLEPGEDFVAGARRETREETGLDVEPEHAWWARAEPWRGPNDPELYAGVGFLARHPGGEVRPECAAHDNSLWATEREWRALPTWYTPEELDVLWAAVESLKSA